MKNRIKEILKIRGFDKVHPTDEFLRRLGIYTHHRFNKILNNKVDMTSAEMVAFMDWLELRSFDDMFEREAEEITA